MKCHYIYTEEGEKILIPECMAVAVSGNIEDCTCKSYSFAEFEKEKYNEALKALKNEIKELEELVEYQNKIIEKLQENMGTKEKSPWIRVSEQLPEDGELVLTRLEIYDFEPKLNIYNGYYQVWNTEDGEDLVCPIMDDDLWMPIPTFDDILNDNKDVLKRLKEK